LTVIVEPGGVTIVSGSELMEGVNDGSSMTDCDEGVSGEKAGGLSSRSSLAD
jgi:hypothetical protein